MQLIQPLEKIKKIKPLEIVYIKFHFTSLKISKPQLLKFSNNQEPKMPIPWNIQGEVHKIPGQKFKKIYSRQQVSKTKIKALKIP